MNQSNRKLLQNHLFLYLTEFFSGMSVMAVELGASRLLAPYFSSSQIVWTIIIGTIMIAMALGNVYGGKSADKNPDPDRLYRRILIAAVWIVLIPLFGKYIITALAGLVIFTISSNYLVWSAFAACLVLFVFPLFLLGTVTPSLAKYSVDSLEDSGRVVGTLGAFNTIGSIIGTFTPTFITIPSVGTSVTFLIFGGILLALALVYFIAAHTQKVLCIVSSILFGVSCVFGSSDSFAFWDRSLAYEGESIYNYLQVRDTDSAVYFSTNVLFGVQSVYMKDAQLTGLYYDYAMAAPLFTDKGSPGDASTLILGMGTGTYAVQCERFYGSTNITGVEIDQRITDLAHQYFDLPQNIPVVTQDGRAFINQDPAYYDVILVDAYQDITIPFSMSSSEFFERVKNHLNDGGVMVVNMNMRSDGEEGINQYLADTIASVFPYVYTVDVPGNTNRELFAFTDPKALEHLSSNVQKLSNAQLKTMMQSVETNLTPYRTGNHVMTDDQAPVELLGMRALDQIIGDETDYYRQVFREKGIRGLIEMLG